MLVLFDIDGTLITHGSRRGPGRRAFERACSEVLGVDGALDGLMLDGMTDPLILRHACMTHLGREATPAESEGVLARYVTHLATEVRDTPYRVLDGVERALDMLAAAGATVGLATGNIEAGARVKLDGVGLWSRFAFGGYGSDAAERAELVRAGLARGRQHARREFAREQCFVVGDTPKDVAAAHAAGAVAVGVTTGSYDADALRAAGADVVISSLHEWP
jgi:phosphoglycolate phosphatase-like HAD superfamily hydrolase